MDAGGASTQEEPKKKNNNVTEKSKEQGSQFNILGRNDIANLEEEIWSNHGTLLQDVNRKKVGMQEEKDNLAKKESKGRTSNSGR